MTDRNVYKVHEVNKHRYYKLPKQLFEDDYYNDMSSRAKVLYSILLDRMELSRQNGWVNENNEIYLKLKRDQAMKLLGVGSKSTMTKTFNELKEKNLIYEERLGQGRANVIYIGKIKYKTSENPGSSKKYKNCTSRSTKTVLQEVQNLYPNETYMNETDNNNTEEEDARTRTKKPASPEAIAAKFEQVFGRTLSVRLHRKIKEIYSDPDIIMLALEVAEEKADKPAYLLSTLEDWASKGLGTTEQITEYIADRAAQSKADKSSASKPDGYDQDLADKRQDVDYLKSRDDWH